MSCRCFHMYSTYIIWGSCFNRRHLCWKHFLFFWCLGMTIGKCNEAVVFIFTDQAILLSNVAASQNDATVDNLAYVVPNQMKANGVVYKEFTSEGGAVHATPVSISGTQVAENCCMQSVRALRFLFIYCAGVFLLVPNHPHYS